MVKHINLLFLLVLSLPLVVFSAKGQSPSKVSDLEKVRSAYRRYLAGTISDKKQILKNTQGTESIKELEPNKHGALMYKLARDWYHHREDISKKSFTKLFAQAYKQGYKAEGKRVTWYPGRNYQKALGLMVEDLDSPYKEQCADFLFYNGHMAENLHWPDDHKGGIDTDYIYCDWFGAFGGVFYKGHDHEAIKNCQRLKRWLEIAFKPSPGTDDFIKADGTSFHHWTHYNGYMYAFTELSHHLYMLHDTRFQINTKAYLFFRDAAYSLLIMCNGQNYANSLAGRRPFQTNLPMSQGAYKKLAKIGGKLLKSGEADPFLAGAYKRLWPTSPDFPQYKAEKFPRGFWQFNYSPIGVYRQANWVATIKGMNKLFWGSEIYPTANRYGRYQSYGTVEIMYPRGREKSGFHEHGWDWNRPCGGTTIILPWDKLLAPLSRIDESSKLDFSGALAVALRENGLNGIEGRYGIYGLDFQERQPSWSGKKSHHHNPSFRFKKSMFCLGEKIICLASDINNDITTRPTSTTLFQAHLKELSDPVLCDGQSIRDFPYKNTLSAKRSHTLIDTSGTGYYIAKGSPIKLRRKEQSSPDQSGNGQMNKGNFSTASIEHGKAPKSAGYEYVIIPNTTKKKLKKIAKTIRSQKLYRVLQKDSFAHVIEYLPKKRLAYVVFEASKKLPDPIKEIDAKCLIMIQSSNKSLRLSLANPVLGLKSRQSTSAKVKTITLLLKGSWRKSNHPSVRIQSHTPSETKLAIDTIDGLPVEAQLTK